VETSGDLGYFGVPGQDIREERGAGV